MASEWQDIVFTDQADSAVLTRAVERGTLRRLATGIYTGAVEDDPSEVVKRNLHRILGHELEEAVIVDRSARRAGPVEGLLVVDHKRRRPLELPGITVLPRRGPGHVAGDMPMPEGLWLSSIPRQLLDNLNRTRSSQRRTLTDEEVEEWVDTLIRERGEEGINRLRDDARSLAEPLSRQSEFKRLDQIISAALTTGDVRILRSERLAARASGEPFDEQRIAVFEALATDLLDRVSMHINALPMDEPRRRLLPFYEAYFSNYIEGTEFTLEEAAAIVFENAVPEDRPADAHDILGTYEVVSNPAEMSRVPHSPEELEEILCSRHARLMGGRPDKLPGQFKKKANRAGSTEFVHPTLVEGTLRRGFEIGRQVVAPLSRAVYMMFLVAEVHPFTDGNGRVARTIMNSELVSCGEMRIVIPTVYRNNYLAALKGATHSGNYAGLYATLDYAQRWTAQVDFTTRDTAEADLVRTNALRDATEADNAGIRLVLPSSIKGS